MPKDDSNAAAGRAAKVTKAMAKDNSDFVSRKLIRPTLSRVETEPGGGAAAAAPALQPSNGDGKAATGEKRRERPKKTPVLEQTHAENFYFQKQMQAKTLMTFVLKNDEEIQGFIDWYDKDCIRITRNGKPNLLLYKDAIRYMYKSGENLAGR